MGGCFKPTEGTCETTKGTQECYDRIQLSFRFTPVFCSGKQGPRAAAECSISLQLLWLTTQLKQALIVPLKGSPGDLAAFRMMLRLTLGFINSKCFVPLHQLGTTKQDKA